MIQTLLNLMGLAVVTGGFVALLSNRIVPSDHELCSSCGQRNQHKLWCANR
jgi:hypothetical protein